MATPFSDLYTVQNVQSRFDAADDLAFKLGACPNCNGAQFAVVAFSSDGRRAWYRCANCKAAVAANDGTISPGLRPLTSPKGLPPTEERVWSEARDCLSVGANTAAVMLCRKLLFHIAVTHGLPEKNDKGRSPTFVEAVKHLEAEELITKKVRPWVDRIKDVGNDANHEITAIDAKLALDVATFTEQLLRLTFEMDAIMANARDEPSE